MVNSMKIIQARIYFPLCLLTDKLNIKETFQLSWAFEAVTNLNSRYRRKSTCTSLILPLYIRSRYLYSAKAWENGGGRKEISLIENKSDDSN